MRANHSPITVDKNYTGNRIELTVPFEFPNFVLNRLSINLFNTLYYRKQRRRHTKFNTYYKPFSFLSIA